MDIIQFAPPSKSKHQSKKKDLEKKGPANGKPEFKNNFVFIEEGGETKDEKLIRSHAMREHSRKKRWQRSQKYRSQLPLHWRRKSLDDELATQGASPSPGSSGAALSTSSSPEPSELELETPDMAAQPRRRRGSQSSQSSLWSLQEKAEQILVEPGSMHNLPMDITDPIKTLFNYGMAHDWQLRPDQSWTFNHSINLQILTSHKATVYQMLAFTSHHRDLMLGRPSSVETLNFKLEGLRCIDDMIRDPATRYSDDVILGIAGLLLVEEHTSSGDSHIHSKAFAQMIRHRGGIHKISSPQARDWLFFILMLASKAQTAYLEYLCPDDGDLFYEDLIQWKRDVNFLLGLLLNLQEWLSSFGDDSSKSSNPALTSPKSLPPLTPLLHHLILQNCPVPTEASPHNFILCYFVLLVWDNVSRNHTSFDNPAERPGLGTTASTSFPSIMEFYTSLTAKLNERPNDAKIFTIAWYLIQGVPADKGAGERKNQAVRLSRVIHRLSPDSRALILGFFKCIIGSSGGASDWMTEYISGGVMTAYSGESVLPFVRLAQRDIRKFGHEALDGLQLPTERTNGLKR